MSKVPAWTVVVLACVLCACSGRGHRGGGEIDASLAEAAGPLPASYKSDILAMLRIYLRDPTNIREASVSRPMPFTGRGRRQAVCLRFDAKNSGGEYSGLRERVAIFSAGRLEQMIEALPNQCDAAAYEPFPEAEKLSR